MDPALLAAIAATTGAAVIRIIDWVGARKVGIGALQTELIDTYDQTVRAQRARIDQLDSDLTSERRARGELERTVAKQEGRIEALERALAQAIVPVASALTTETTTTTRRRSRRRTNEEAPS